MLVDGEIAVTPSLSDVGDVIVGEEATFFLNVEWVSGSRVRILGSEIDAEFFTFDAAQIPEGGLFVDRDEPALLEFRFAPTEEGYHDATIELLNDSRVPRIALAARGHGTLGAASVIPRVLDFGAVASGDSYTLDLTVKNEGSTDLSVSDATFSNPAFRLGGSGPFVLRANEQVQVPITFTAPDGLAQAGTADLVLDGFVRVATITLRGNDCENGAPSAYDVDEDGYTSCGGDCDDRDDDVHPGMPEGYDGVDQDCNGTVDENTEGYDDDGDGQTELDGDCNDGANGVNEAVIEDYANGIDDDCDGVVDFGTTDVDADGYSDAGGDCDDGDGATFPGAPEIEDGIDNDCDGVLDEGTVAYDDDGDGQSEALGDCDDSDASIYSGAVEAADWTDNDCDATVDEGTSNYDDDADGYNEVGGDCDDVVPAVNPGEPERSGNGVDDDCDGTAS